jgi:seryl-tRNA synthetase
VAEAQSSYGHSATPRLITAIIENYQQPDGTIKVPDVLVPYMNGKSILGKPFRV